MKLFGKTIGATAIIAIMLTASLGATVLYLSGQASSEVVVSQPFEALMSADGSTDWKTDLTLASKFGGEMSVFYIRYQNFANETISVNVETTITNSDGITRADFEHPDDGEVGGLYFELYNNGSMIDNGTFNEGPYTIETDPKELTICGSTSGIFPMDVPALEIYIVKIEMYHAPNAYGIYKTTTQVMDV